MLTDFNGADRVYIACGYTDLRRGIDGLAKDADLTDAEVVQKLMPWNMQEERK